MNTLLEIQDLKGTYINTGKQVFADISLSIAKGEKIGLLGQSGCGKTTLISIINGTLNDKELRKEFKKYDTFSDLKISTVFQRPTLMPWRDVLENISYPLEILNESKSERLEKARSALNKVNLGDYGSYRVKELSVGMQQRINLARAFCTDPNLILLDEPFSSIDIKNKKQIKRELINYLDNGKTSCLLVSHNIEDVLDMCEKIIILGGKPTKIIKTFKQTEQKNRQEFIGKIEKCLKK
jgi:NitT/TauT family transport system ATP-binding protein